MGNSLDSGFLNTVDLPPYWQAIEKWPNQLHSIEQTRAIDAYAIEIGTPGIVLMKRAAQAVLNRILLSSSEPEPCKPPIIVFCGSGNNAGDGFLIAKLAHEKGFQVRVIELGDSERIKGDAALARNAMLESGLSTLAWSEELASNLQEANKGLSEIIVDALLGTGISGGLRPEYATAIQWINARHERTKVIAVDVPSGLNAESGGVRDDAVHADETVTFITIKKGLLTNDAPDHCGKIFYDDLDVANTRRAFPSSISRLSLPDIIQGLPRRDVTAHKYSTSSLVVVAGGKNMGGAGILSASSALRMGSGLVHLKTHHAHINAALALQPELLVEGIGDEPSARSASFLPDKAGVLVIGPGLGRDQWAKRLLTGALDEAIERQIKVVLDADALFLLAGSDELTDKVLALRDTVLTPHAGEAGRLLAVGGKGLDRFEVAQTLVERYQSTVVLKGAGTLVASVSITEENQKDGSFDIAICPYGNSILATAGTGDVLAGLVGGLLAQGMNVFDAAKTAVGLHAAAADYWRHQKGRYGFSAGCLLETVPELIAVCEARQ